MTAARSKASRKPAARGSAAKKTAARKPAAKTTIAKKTVAKKATAKKPAVKKTATTKPAARTPAAAKPSAKAPAATKPAPRAKAGAGSPASIATLMTYALWLELDAVERYRELADAMEMHNNRDVSELFRKMAAIEGRHADKIMKQMAWTKVPPLPPGPSPWPGFESPETVAHEEVHYLMQPWHALSLALKGEERAHRFFARLASEATVPAVKRAATEMADEEREHVELVRSWMTKVPRPDDDWRDDPDPPRYTD